MKKCDKYERMYTFLPEDEFLRHVESCPDCKAQYERERALSAIIRDAAPYYRKVEAHKRRRGMFVKTACLFLLFTAIGTYTGVEVKTHHDNVAVIREFSADSVITQEGLPTDKYGFFDYE